MRSNLATCKEGRPAHERSDRRVVGPDRLAPRGVVRVRGATRWSAASPSTSTPARWSRSSGPTASGKTTLVRGLLGLSDRLGGEVDAVRHPAARFRERSRIGYVPQRHTVGGVGPVDRRGDRRLRPAAAPALVGRPSSRPTAQVIAGARRRRPGRPRRDRRQHALRRPAAPRADRPRPGRPARGARHGRADRRGGRRPTSTSSPRCSAGWPLAGVTMLVVTHEVDALRRGRDAASWSSTADGVAFDGPRDGYLAPAEADGPARAGHDPPPTTTSCPTVAARPLTGDRRGRRPPGARRDRDPLVRLHAAGAARGAARRPRRPARRRLPRAAPAVADRRRDGPRRARRRRGGPAHRTRTGLDGAGRRGRRGRRDRADPRLGPDAAATSPSP